MDIDFYINILDNDDRGVIILDLKGTLVYKNRKADFLFLKKENFIEKLFADYIEKFINKLSFSSFKKIFSENGLVFSAKKVLFQKKIFIFIIFKKDKEEAKEIKTNADSIFFYWEANMENSRFSYAFISQGFENITGYNGKPIKSSTQLAKELKMTSPAISYRVNKIVNKLKEVPDAGVG